MKNFCKFLSFLFKNPYKDISFSSFLSQEKLVPFLPPSNAENVKEGITHLDIEEAHQSQKIVWRNFLVWLFFLWSFGGLQKIHLCLSKG